MVATSWTKSRSSKSLKPLTVVHRIDQLYIGECTEELGYIIGIWKYHLDNIDELEGVVQDTTGQVIFSIRFDAIAFKPISNEILDGVVHSLNKDGSGIEVHSGPLKCYIKSDVS